MTSERWLPVVGFEGLYEVSDLGRVRSLDRIIICSGEVKGTYFSLKKGRTLRPGPMNSGHLTVVLGRRKTHSVHALVMRAFVGPYPDGCEIRHLDGNEANNKLSNLAWGTRGDNNRDKKWHRGCSRYKLSPTQITLIKKELFGDNRRTYKAIGLEYSVSRSTIYSIAKNKTHIDVKY